MLMSSWRLKTGVFMGDQKQAEVVGPSLVSHPPSWVFWLSLDLCHPGPARRGKDRVYFSGRCDPLHQSWLAALEAVRG